jgi:hypothetical protein
MDSRELRGLAEAYQAVHAPQEVDEAVYGGEPKKEAPKDDRMVVTNADKKANTKAYQNFKAGVKGYKAADHMREEVVDEMVKGVDPEQRKALAAERKSGIKPLPAKEGERYAKYKMSQMAYSQRAKNEEFVDEATAMAKRGYDEAPIRREIASKTSGGQAADRATALADKKTFGQRGVDPKARQDLARKQRGDFRKTTSSSPGLKGYAYKATTDADKAKQAARGAQRGSAALTPNEKKSLNREEFDLFDTILEYLVTEGYADTNEAALVIMGNMSEQWRDSIVETKFDPRGRPASGPYNVYANSKKPDPAQVAAAKEYDEKQKKKTPEQRKAELDAYIERQMNNK